MSQTGRPPQTAKTSKPPRVRLENDERRLKLLELGKKLFGERGYEELSIESIAALAGISKGLLYHYFPTKRHFYVETIRHAAEEMLRLIEPPRGAPPVEALSHGLEAYLDYVTRNAAAYLALMHGGIGVDPEVVAIIEGVRGTIVTRLLEQLGARADAEQELALKGWVGFAEAASVAWLEKRKISRARLRKLLESQLLGTLVAVRLLPAGRAPWQALLKRILK